MSRQFRTDQHRGEAQKLPFNGYTPYSPDRLTPQKKNRKNQPFKEQPCSAAFPSAAFHNPFHASSLAEQPFSAVFLKPSSAPFFLVKSHNQQHFSATFLSSFRSRVLQLATVKVGGQLVIVRVGGQLATVKRGGQLGTVWVGGQVFYVISRSSYIAHFFGIRNKNALFGQHWCTVLQDLIFNLKNDEKCAFSTPL